MKCPSILLLALVSVAPALAQVSPSLYQELKHRMIGPHRAGRTVGAVGIPSQPNVFFMGANNGGVWKTDDYGRTWKPLLDQMSTGSIGDIAVSPSSPSVIYVGTGEGLHRPDLSVGDGMFKSTDGGKSWTHIGLDDAQQIGRVVVHPTNPDIAFAAVLGHDGAVLAHGRTHRLATPAQRRAVYARDRGCVIPGCTAPPPWCDVHHATPWADGGLTGVEALVLVCGHHHTAVHAGTWTIQMIKGVPWVIPPPWIDPLQRPIRNTIHHDEAAAHRLAAHLGDQLALDVDTGLDLDPATGASPTSPTSAGLRGAEPCSPGRPPPPSTCPETSPETSEPPSPPDDP